MDITHITSLLGGVALFLYGMSIMGAGLEKLASRVLFSAPSSPASSSRRLVRWLFVSVWSTPVS